MKLGQVSHLRCTPPPLSVPCRWSQGTQWSHPQGPSPAGHTRSTHMCKQADQVVAAGSSSVLQWQLHIVGSLSCFCGLRLAACIATSA
jgi:hypothetical protein